MCGARVLVLLLLLVSSARSFSWDIVVGGDKQLNFYFNGILMHTEHVPDNTSTIESVTYDPIHYRLIFSQFNSTTEAIYSFDLSTREIQPVLTKNAGSYVRVVYDYVTQALYWKEGFELYSFSLHPATSNQAKGGKLLVSLDHFCLDIDVDGCGGYIYWVTQEEIERARLDGSDREVLIKSKVFNRRSLAIDQKTQTMYWIERTHNIEDDIDIKSASFNGNNTKTLYSIANARYSTSLTLSEDFIYWENYNQKGIWQLPKNSSGKRARKLHTKLECECAYCHRIAINYTIKEQIQGLQSCDTLQGPIPYDSKSESTESICQNYCFQGECSVSNGHPTCSCEEGYFGERCDFVNACHDYCLHGGICTLNEENMRVCQCTAGYLGERCEANACHDYCLHGGHCSLNDKNNRVCHCTADYLGKRCEENACLDYCLHDGLCSLNEKNKRVCHCTAGYLGERCEVNACHEYCLNGGVCSLNEEDGPVCQCTAGYNGGRCEVSANNSCDVGNSGEETVSACHQFCLNNGVCSLNEASEPVCQCTADYEGDRCEVSLNKDFCFQAACTVSADGQPKVTVTLGKGEQSTCASTLSGDSQDMKKLTVFKRELH